jgi:uncharacterized protein (TIGR03435 family)
MRFLSFLISLSFLCAPSMAQERLGFDVVSIHPSNANDLNGGIKPLPGGYGYEAKNIPVKLMISLMYRVPMRQIEGAPEWLSSERFDVEAKADHAYGVEDLREMYRNMLAERFSLRFHKESRPGNIYALTVDPGGLKMKRNDSPQDYKIPVNFTANGFMGRRVPMPYLCWFLGGQLQDDARPVVDQTGLEGNYDFDLSFRPLRGGGEDAGAAADDRPMLYDALRQQLGLKLQPAKGQVEYLVIDGVERPSAN